jgi:hypothetical protein
MDRSSMDYGVLLENRVQFKTITKAKKFVDNIPLYLEQNRLIGKPIIGSNGGSSNGRTRANVNS